MRVCSIAAVLIAITISLAAQDTKLLASSNDLAEFQAKAQAGDSVAQVALGRAYEQGQGVQQSDELAVKWYRAAAAQGNADGQNSLGVMYLLGHGVEKDKAEAVKWYQKSALQGHAPAYFNLGTAYYNGDGVPVNDTFAYAWFALAARAGLASATEAVARQAQQMSPRLLEDGRMTVAMMLIRGTQVPKDLSAGLGMLEELAKQGSAEAQGRIGLAYAIRGDFAAARSICAKAEKTWAGAYCLGYVYENNQSGANMKKAVSYYRRAALAGHPESMMQLARIYAEGRGVTQDKPLALAWCFLAELWLSGATAETALQRQKLEADLSPQELERSAKKAQELREQIRGFPISRGR